MTSKSQKRALKSYRERLGKNGLARFEVLGLDEDRDLIRSVARRLAENNADAKRLRAKVVRSIAGEPPQRGGVIAALRRSPLVGAELDTTRQTVVGRKVRL